MLINTVKSALLHGNLEQELCHLEMQKNLINTGKKSMTRNDCKSCAQAKIYRILEFYINSIYLPNLLTFHIFLRKESIIYILNLIYNK